MVSSLFTVSGLSSFSLEKGHDRGKKDVQSLLLGSLNPKPKLCDLWTACSCASICNRLFGCSSSKDAGALGWAWDGGP